MECLAAIQRGQQHPKQVKPDTHSHSGTTSLVASVGSKVSVQLHATELVAELIANTQQPDAGSAEHPGEPLSTQEPYWGLGDYLKVYFIAFLGLPDGSLADRVYQAVACAAVRSTALCSL